MSRGSKKPIIPPVIEHDPGENDLFECRDGSRKSAIDILVAVRGDIEIACERANDTPVEEFMFALAKTNPTRLAEGMKAIQLFDVFRLAQKVGQRLEDDLDEVKPGQLVHLYPKLVELIPVLSESKIKVQATQNNTYNFGQGPEIPDDVREAFERLGIPMPGLPELAEATA